MIMKFCLINKGCGCFFLGAASCGILIQVFTRPRSLFYDQKQEVPVVTNNHPAPALRVAPLPLAPAPAPRLQRPERPERPERLERLERTAVPAAMRSAASNVAKCELPPGGRWATVQLTGLTSFQMAVYASHDIVSSSVSFRHNWEQLDVRRFGKPGHACDIGGNIGFYTFALAKAGWNLTTFEAMPSNVALMKATLCANEELQERVDLHQVGLGDTPGRCSLMSDTINVGDGIVVCRTMQDPTKNIRAQFAFRTEFEVKRFDEVFPQGRFASTPIDFVKIDVEGFECKVFQGAHELLKQAPHIIQSEVWGTMQGCTPAEYLKLFTDAGYRVKRDAGCSMDVNLKQLPVAGQIVDYWMCH